MRLSRLLTGALLIVGQALPVAALATTISPYAHPTHELVRPSVCDPMLEGYIRRPPCLPPFVDPRVVDGPIIWNDCCRTVVGVPPYHQPFPMMTNPQ